MGLRRTREIKLWGMYLFNQSLMFNTYMHLIWLCVSIKRLFSCLRWNVIRICLEGSQEFNNLKKISIYYISSWNRTWKIIFSCFHFTLLFHSHSTNFRNAYNKNYILYRITFKTHLATYSLKNDFSLRNLVQKVFHFFNAIRRFCFYFLFTLKGVFFFWFEV